MIEVLIDGNKTLAGAGETILRVAKRMGIYIPTLCHHQALTPYGSCRLCVVETMRKGRRRIVTACNFPIQEETEIFTSSEKVIRMRKMIMELLLARCPEVKAIQDMASKLGVESTRFNKDNKNCILCGLCVGVCEEIIGACAISFVDRGIDEDIDTPYHISSEVCIGCGSCAAVCPTGAITLEKIQDMLYIEKFNTSKKLSKCPCCGRLYASETLVDRVSHKLGPLSSLASVCGECKRSNTSRTAFNIESLFSRISRN